MNSKKDFKPRKENSSVYGTIFFIIIVMYIIIIINLMDGVEECLFMTIGINALLIVLFVLSLFYINKTYKDKFKEVKEYEYYRNLDIKNISAVASGILTKKLKIDINTIITAIYELSEKNIIEIKWEDGKNILKLKEHNKTQIDQLLSYEKSIIKFIFESPKDTKEYCIEDILKEVENDATKRYVLKEIEKEIKVYIDKKYYYNSAEYLSNQETMLWVKIIPVICIIVCVFSNLPSFSILITIGFSYWITNILLIEHFANILLVTYYCKMKFIKSKYHDEVQKIYGLYAYLSDYSLLKNQELKFYQLYNKYYIYAMGLGIADKFEKELNQNVLDNDVRTALQFYLQNKEDL